MEITETMERKDIDYFISRIDRSRLEKRPSALRIHIGDSKSLLLGGMEYFSGHHAEWVEGYDRITGWLSDNGGKSLVVTGPYGVGKTILCMYVLPVLIGQYYGKIFEKFRATELCNEANYRKAMAARFVVIDDVGTEGQFIDFGNRHDVFSEIVDGIEQQGKLVIASTNLTPQELRKKYGERTFDRLCANAMIANVVSESLRGKYERKN